MEGSKENSITSLQMEKKPRVRFFVLLLLCLMSSCFIFCYNSPGALQHDVMNQFSLNNFWFAVIYSAFYWPNILCFAGGYLVDRVIGLKYGTIMFVSLAVLGNVICAGGGFLNSYWMMVIGRFLYGCAGDSIAVSLNLYGLLWFSGKELAMVMAINQSFPMVGASLVYQVAHPLLRYVRLFNNDSNSLGLTLLVISAATFISVLCSIVLALLYPKSNDHKLNSEEVYQKELIKISDIRNLPIQFWILCLICDIFFNSIFTFIDLSQNFFRLKYGMDVDSADDVISSFSIISCLSSPLLSILVDYMGRNLYFAALSAMVSIGAHFIASSTIISPYITMFMISISYSLMIGSIWPLFSRIASKDQQGSIYGLVMASMNATMAVGVLISGRIIDQFGYAAVEAYYIMNLLITVGLCILVWIIDTKRDGILNKSPIERLFSQKSLNRSVSLERLH